MTVELRIHIEPLPEGMWADGKRVDAFESVYRRCYPQLVDLCRRSLCGRGDPEAMAQEAFVRAWSSLDRFSGARPFWPWVATIAKRLCIDHRRRLDREALHLHVAAAVNERESVAPDEAVENDEEYRSVLTALRGLKPSEQRVITLRDVNGWSYDQIAQFEGVTVESIRGSLKRARASLRKSFAKLGAGAPAAVVVRPWRSLQSRVTQSAVVVQRHLSSVLLPDAVSQVVAGVAAAAIAFGTVAPSTFDDTSLSTALPVSAVVDAGPAGVATRPPRVAPAAPATTTSGNTPTGVDSADPAPGVPVIDVVLPSDLVKSPDDAVVTSMAVSPSYEEDGTVFATGTAAKSCPHLTCPVLFVSRDRGASWQRLASTGLVSGAVLLPPTYPADPRIFVASYNVLQVSEDGGASFGAVVPIGGAAAISPRFDQDRRILLGQAPGWEYRDDLEAMHPSGMVTGSTSLSATPVFSPAYETDQTVFVGGTAPTVAGAQQSAVFRCVEGVCAAAPARLPGIDGPPQIVVSPDVARDGLVVAWRGRSLFRSTDSGVAFDPVSLPVAGAVQSVVIDRRHGILAGVRRLDGKSTVGALLQSRDGGQTWSVLGAGDPLRTGVESVAVLPDGRILAGVAAAGGAGMLCSTDGGRSWFRRCA